MRARCIGIPAAFVAAFLLCITFNIILNNALCAQQPTNPARASAVLPAAVQSKLDTLQGELQVAREKSDSQAQAKILNEIGELHSGVSAYPQAMDDYNQALAQARVAKDAVSEAAALNGIGSCYRNQSQNGKALEFYKQALDVATASDDPLGQATALNGMGWVNENTGQFKGALELLNRALPLARMAKDKSLEGSVLRRIASVDRRQGELQKALEILNQALELFRQVGDRSGEAKTLLTIGVVEWGLGKPQQALDNDQRALAVFRETGDRSSEALTLNCIGIVYWGIGEEHKALDTYNQTLAIDRQLGDRNAEANALTAIGLAYSDLGEGMRSLEYHNQALDIYRQLGNRDSESMTLNNIGLVYLYMGELEKALDAFNEALPVFHASGDRASEASLLQNIGIIYAQLGENKKALNTNEKALLLFRQTGNRAGVCRTLNEIGSIYMGMSNPARALEEHRQALAICRQVGDRDSMAWALSYLGYDNDNLGEKQKALDYLNRSLPIFREVGDRRGEAGVLNVIGEVYDEERRHEKALTYYYQALSLATAIKDPLLEADILDSMMLNLKVKEPSLAIFYGKQAVNLLQQTRGNIQGLEASMQKSFLTSKADYYHDLGALLIEQGRLSEAQQVLDLLKHQEYRDYVRGEKVNAADPLSLTAAEADAEAEYQKSTSQLVALGEEWSTLKKMTQRTPEQDEQFQKLSEQMNAASKSLNDYYARLYTLFGNNSEANKQVADVKGDVSVLRQTIAKMPHTVALYTLVGKDRYNVIVITGSTAVAREYAITEKELNQKVAAFQQVLRDPRSDAKPQAQELYKILIGPVKADLEQAKAETLVWSLDGALRYLPIAALYDGKQYIVEKYSTVRITPVSIPHLKEKPEFNNLSAAAMGISRQYEERLSALPSVAGELDEIVKDAQVKDSNGVLPGRILLNADFTEKAMENVLSGPHMVVHIASHFVFRPGDDSQSYLLLAGKDQDKAGYHMTVADFRDDQKLSLDDTELLTLSACETGMGGSAGNGREVDGLGTTSQLKGAKAVISTLWSVNDASTGALMADFYKRWAEGAGKVTKADALREAQLDLLLGRTKAPTEPNGRGITAEGMHQSGGVGFAHPYYWAPFVLMGNWQ